MAISFEAIGERLVTFAAGSGLTAGKVCKISANGTVGPCCLDHEGDVPLGNLFSQELDEILGSAPAQALLSGFAARKLTQPLCRRCGYARRFR